MNFCNNDNKPPLVDIGQGTSRTTINESDIEDGAFIGTLVIAAAVAAGILMGLMALL